MDYYIADANQRRGPFPQEQLLAQGLRPDTLVWREGMADWMPASAVAELQPVLAALQTPAQPAASPAYPPAGANPQAGGYAPQQLGYGTYAPYVPPYNPSDVSSKKILAGIFALLLGGLGIHKFILGMPGAGVAMLLISILGGLATCGVAAIVMHVIALVEGIIYLTKSDAEFYQAYMVERRSWF